MAPAQRKNAQSTAAEISLVHLKNCLVNLPTSLVNLLVNINTPAQNVVVELNYRVPPPANGSSQANGTSSSQRSLYVGWTGMPSKRKIAPIVDRDGITSMRGSGRDQEVASVEMDATLAATLGLSDGQKVMAIIHVDPPLAHTVNIEPLTPEDWEIIELHATFLELNLLSQIRALPNPAYTGVPGQPPNAHPLTLHLSPTSTANIKILSLEPAPAADVPFVKIAPDAEVIVAPKTRSKPSKSTREDRSVGGTSRRSGKSSASTVRKKSAREEKKPALFLRGVDRKFCDEWFDEESAPQDLSVWVDRDLLLSKDFRGVTWVAVNIVKPAGLQPPLDPQKQQENAAGSETIKATERIVAQLRPWDDPPSTQTTALSAPLCAMLGCSGMVGGIVKIEAAPPPLSRNAIQKLKISPFSTDDRRSSEGLKFGGESKAEKEEASKRISHIYGQKGKINGLLRGPLTDGMVLPVYDSLELSHGWEGGVAKLDGTNLDSNSKDNLNWYLGSEKSISIEVQPPISRPTWLAENSEGEHGPPSDSVLVGIDSLLADLKSHLSHMSSVLLSGALGAGKTAVVQSLAQTLREEFLFHTTYFPCRKLVNDESRISTIKETLNRVFMSASWGARLGGRALVILDDLDKLCPVETELQVGNDNSRSRQVSETISSIVRQYCGRDKGVVLLATAQGKESLNNVIIGGHVVREIVDLKAPDKEARRRVLETVVKQQTVSRESLQGPASFGSRPTTANGSAGGDDDGAWMDGADQRSRGNSVSTNPKLDGFLLDPDLDFLDLAGETDGYMPGDLILLVSRARNEALIRSVSEDASKGLLDIIQLGRADFDNALKGFTPASLRNVSLQTSTTTFDSIGGLKETRQILLETLQYPTKYAPIFAQCPLRLRSGLLLYGYPGCGKTLLASAVAGECGLNFISVKGPEILNKYIGASEKSVRDLFERASAAKPCVLFFDEFDSIAPKRGHDSTGVTDRVVNQLLTQMDGAEGLSGVYVLAATSRPDLIDPALLRPGRLDKSLICGFPNLEDRVDILQALGKKVKLSEEITSSEEGLLEIARRTEGYSGADLQALMSNAQLEAIHDVLNDMESQPSGDKRGAAGSRNKAGATVRSRNFLQFRYGIEAALAEVEERAKKGYNKSTQLSENAAIAAKLAEIKAAKKQAKLVQKGTNHAAGDNNEKGKGGSNTEVLIGWKHMTKALESTRASISPQERNRLERIYREFVVGRSGEMHDGQGSMEIGGRSSLM
ncbi:AAA-domain-containing protein [Hypomontagnella monticulosa]|nr:AAA-domain-containing protein [Hypomontagnella monticulosa]